MEKKYEKEKKIQNQKKLFYFPFIFSFLSRLMLTWWSHLPCNIVYDIYNDGLNPAYNEHHFGLLYNNFTDKPAMVAVRYLSSQAVGRTFSGLLTWPGSSDTLVHVAKIVGATDTVYVAWTEVKEVVFSFPLGSTAKSMFGTAMTPTVANGKNNINVKLNQGICPYFDLMHYNYLGPIISLFLDSTAFNTS